MPRAKGGVRTGAPGTAYGNRTDLNAKMPVQAATNQAYGVAAQQRAAQRAIPVAAQPVQGANPSMGPQVAAPSAPPSPAALVEQASPMISQLPPMQQFDPGNLGFMDETMDPSVPVTNGAPTGPGAGPEVLSGMGQISLADTLRQMAMMPGADPTLMDIAHAAQVLGY